MEELIGQNRELENLRKQHVAEIERFTQDIANQKRNLKETEDQLRREQVNSERLKEKFYF